jgi:hypothetical protein
MGTTRSPAKSDILETSVLRAPESRAWAQLKPFFAHRGEPFVLCADAPGRGAGVKGGSDGRPGRTASEAESLTPGTLFIALRAVTSLRLEAPLGQAARVGRDQFRVLSARTP